MPSSPASLSSCLPPPAFLSSLSCLPLCLLLLPSSPPSPAFLSAFLLPSSPAFLSAFLSCLPLLPLCLPLLPSSPAFLSAFLSCLPLLPSSPAVCRLPSTGITPYLTRPLKSTNLLT
ncbi:hypothetical protein CesoFtcFv8_023792 [Champsocephalus esox]|uniref:Uncharacterized protein n=1 Tax=Champsocephalus esox TaxID=159716 RepID=A0AAN8B4P1_9TELE|nr:hypothetical protein CesoFtcFv8_023792 [Champsocephalus esox]